MLEAHGDVPPVPHQRGLRQRLALQRPQPGMTIAQHRRRRVRVHSGSTERLRERFGRGRLVVAGEGEAVLAAIGVDHLARDHLEMALLLAVPAAHVAAIKPNYDGGGWRRRRPRRGLDGVLPHNVLAHPQRPVSDRARVLRPTDRQQFGQQHRNLTERRQRRIPGGDVGKLWRDRIMAEIQRGEALRPTMALTGTGQQPLDPHRHIAKQRAELHGGVALARQPAPAAIATATALTHHRHLHRHDMTLKGRHELLRLGQPKPKVSHAGLPIAFDAGHLGLRHLTRLQLRHQFHPRHQPRHHSQPHPVSTDPIPTKSAPPQDFVPRDNQGENLIQIVALQFCMLSFPAADPSEDFHADDGRDLDEDVAAPSLR
jgi:hypothetical protein